MTTINKKLSNRQKPNFAQSRPDTEKPTPGIKNVVFSK